MRPRPTRSDASDCSARSALAGGGRCRVPSRADCLACHGSAAVPVPVYNHFTDADLDAVFADLQTLPPVRNPEPLPPAPPTAPATAKR
jgi:hypothetical protein